MGFLLSALLASGLTLQSPDGRRVVTAVESRAPITLDGALDEEAWRDGEPADGFVQAEPHEGQPATELTEVRLAFDRDALYIGVVCHDTDPAGIIVNDIRKDFIAGEQDTFEVILDTFADRRNGFVFVTTAAGAKSDTQIANEGRDVNTSWDAVWTVATKRDAGGWSAEIRIPFKTLRFERGADRIWGVNFSRRIRRKNETDYWSPVPRVYNLYRAGLGGTLAGLPDASQGRNLRVKPWMSADSTRPLAGASFEAGAHVGLDLKYGVTPSLTLDVTAKPDFAQAEADEQQVNLTQFSLYYPEKREFFLENSGTFYFGDIPRESRLGNNRFSAPEEEMLLFFSRRIGLTGAGEPIPIDAGARLTGRAGAYGIGLMTIQTDPDGRAAGDNYTVLRGRRDVLGTSDVGAIFLSRQSTNSGDYNRVFGADANFRFHRALSINGFLAKSETPGVRDGQMSGKGSIVWNDNFLHTQYSMLSVGDNFRDDIGIPQDVAAAAQHGVVVAVPAVVRLRLNRHQPDAGPSDATGEPAARRNRNLLPGRRQADAAREEQQHLLFRRREPRVAEPRLARDVAEVEHPGVLEEELALLGEEQAELRQVHLLLVGLGLREIGLRGDVEGQRRRDAVLDVETRVDVGVEFPAAEGARRVGTDPRFDPQVPSLARIGQPRQCAGQAGTIQVVDTRHRGPVIDFVLAADPPAEIDAPNPIGARFETERLERNAQFSRPTGGVAPGRHRPHRIPAGVDVASLIGDLGVGLGPDGVGHEDEPVAAVGEGVENELERVLFARDEVLADVVDDQARRIAAVTDDADVERVAIEGQAHFGALRRRLPFMRFCLEELRRRHGNPPHLFVERSIQCDGRPCLDGIDGPATVGRLEREIRGGDRRGQEQSQKKKPRPTAEAVTKGKFARHAMNDGSGTGNRTPI